MKNTALKLNKVQLNSIIKESINKILKEDSYDNSGNFSPLDHNNACIEKVKRIIENCARDISMVATEAVGQVSHNISNISVDIRKIGRNLIQYME